MVHCCIMRTTLGCQDQKKATCSAVRKNPLTLLPAGIKDHLGPHWIENCKNSLEKDKRLCTLVSIGRHSSGLKWQMSMLNDADRSHISSYIVILCHLLILLIRVSNHIKSLKISLWEVDMLYLHCFLHATQRASASCAKALALVCARNKLNRHSPVLARIGLQKDGIQDTSA